MNTLTKVKLQAILQAMDMSKTGTKEELIQRVKMFACNNEPVPIHKPLKQSPIPLFADRSGKEMKPKDIKIPSDVMYKGHPLLDYAGKVQELVHRLDTNVYQIEPWDTEECYLGYLPKEDEFVIGFEAIPVFDYEETDEDEEEDNRRQHNMHPIHSFAIRVKYNGHVMVKQKVHTHESMFYIGLYKNLKKEYKNLLDIRVASQYIK